jgi:hypothetical protein
MKDGSVEELAGRLGARGGMHPLFFAFREIEEIFDGDGSLGFKEANLDAAFGGVECRVGSRCDCHKDS